MTTGNIIMGGPSMTGNITIGGASQTTGNILIGPSANTSNILIGSGATLASNIKSILIGQNGVAASNTTIQMGPALGNGNIVISANTIMTLANTGNATLSVAGNIRTANVVATGNISVTGNMQAGNISTAGNVNGANIVATTLSATGAVAFSGTTTTISIGTAATTGAITIGGTAMTTGNITLGQATTTSNIIIGGGITAAAATKVINIGQNGAAASTTTISIGPLLGNGSVSLSANTTLALANTGNAALSVAGNVYGNNVRATGFLRSSGVTAGIGYFTGAGLSATQATNRATSVTVNAVTGNIALFNVAGNTTPTTFQMLNSTIAATDLLLLNQVSGTNLYITLVNGLAAGTANITVYTTGGITAEAPVFNFAVIKGNSA